MCKNCVKALRDFFKFKKVKLLFLKVVLKQKKSKQSEFYFLNLKQFFSFLIRWPKKVIFLDHIIRNFVKMIFIFVWFFFFFERKERRPNHCDTGRCGKGRLLERRQPLGSPKCAETRPPPVRRHDNGIIGKTSPPIQDEPTPPVYALHLLDAAENNEEWELNLCHKEH
ncbi:hypothetical protein HanPI659440_Chr13g0513671 [Helianthus annuus]|nr:hypothetical protein HanPI659440_Chr13g0513671 [Helianthus annuus]